MPFNFLTKINLVIIHGIGVNKPGYTAALVAGIRGEFNRTLQRTLQNKEDSVLFLNHVFH